MQRDREMLRHYAFYTNVASTARSREEHERLIERWVNATLRAWHS